MTSLETLQSAVTQLVSDLETIKGLIAGLKENTITPEEVTTEMDRISAEIENIKNTVNPPA